MPYGKLENHTHLCETKMIRGSYAKCNFSRRENTISRLGAVISQAIKPRIRNRDMGNEDLCDFCMHMRIVNLSDDGETITGIE